LKFFYLVTNLLLELQTLVCQLEFRHVGSLSNYFSDKTSGQARCPLYPAHSLK